MHVAGWVNKYIGIPYRFGGYGMDGSDCWGLVRMIQRIEYGRELPAYEHDSADQFVLGAIVDSALPTAPVEKVTEPAEGDLVLLRICGQPCHIGVIAGGGQMVHTLFKHDSACESYTGSRWSERVEGFYRVR